MSAIAQENENNEEINTTNEGQGVFPITKGSFTLGGSMRVSDPNTEINIGGGYFFTNRFALGANASYSSNNNDLDLEIRARYYFPIIDNTYIFAQASIEVTNPIVFSIGPGIAYFLNDRVAIEGSLNNLGGGGVGLFFLFK
ncbi:MAG: porin family protein [Cyclobacteriaceae bacterium]|nr:hypothetical protein [Cyclobacteriaceae bacterium]MCH8517682.1 porin family protein [Cyclobacteriaceae bacterium]